MPTKKTTKKPLPTPKRASKAAPKASKPATAKKAPTLEGEALCEAIARAAQERNATDIEIIDVRGKVDYTDYVLVMAGRSDRQVQGIATGMEGDLKKKHNVRALAVEGLTHGSWVLVDFGDAIAHVFHEDVRGYYDLENLWMDATRIPTPSLIPSEAPSGDPGQTS